MARKTAVTKRKPKAKARKKPAAKATGAEKKGDFGAVFARLRGILAAHTPELPVMRDDAKAYYIGMKRSGVFFDSLPEKQKKKPLMFGATIRGKAYVSFHLIPVYACPDLRNDLSPELRKRMQGKACFNFSTVDEPLFEELAALTRRGLHALETRPMGKGGCD